MECTLLDVIPYECSNVEQQPVSRTHRRHLQILQYLQDNRNRLVLFQAHHTRKNPELQATFRHIQFIHLHLALRTQFTSTNNSCVPFGTSIFNAQTFRFFCIFLSIYICRYNFFRLIFELNKILFLFF